MKAIDILLVVVAQKLKKRIDKIQALSKTIKDLVGGKSTVQNEILGDLQQELASAPEKGQELPLEELGSALGSGFNGSLGKYSTGLVSRLVSGKMPDGFNASSPAPMVYFSPPLSNPPSALHLKLRLRLGSTVLFLFTLSDQEFLWLPRALQVLVETEVETQ